MSSPEVYAKLSAKESAKLGLPDGWKTFTPFPFGGMDQQSSRVALKDNEYFWRENFVRIGDGNMRTLWDKGVPLYTAQFPLTIASFFFYNIGSTNYAAVFLSDGTGIQVNSSTGAQIVMSSVPGTFYQSGFPFPAVSQWGTLYLLIANRMTPDDYWIWDGAVLYQAGSLGPGVMLTSGGSGYSSAPTITAFGGSGSGISAVATIANGSVVQILLTNPGAGYLPGETVQFAFSGGGSDDSAILEAVLTTGTIGHIQLLSSGSGFTPGTYALSFSGGGGGSGAAATYTADGTGKVIGINLANPGSGYTSTPTVSFSSGGGTGATGVVILNPGSVASVNVINGGTGFTATPTLTFVGGGGISATAVANLTSGVISSVTVTAGGTGYTSVPAVEVQTGLNNAASATATLMPFGVSGSAIETFQQRVWLFFPNQTGNQENGGTFLVSTPGSVTDFATSDGGVTYTSTDSFLRYQYTNAKQSNGYLYPIGDSSVDVISNVQTSGNPTTTTFNYQNTDPQIGTSWRDTVVDYSRTILLANPLGVYGLYGGSVTKLSSKMDDLFTNFVSPQNGGITPTAAVANIFSQKIYLLNMTITDIYTDLPRTVMLSWDEKEWFVSSQSVPCTYIGSQEINSNITAWGTDGTSLFPLFNQPSSSLKKLFSTKLYGAQAGYIIKQAMGLYVQVQDLTATGTGVVFDTATIDNEVGVFPMPNVIASPAGLPPAPLVAPVIATQTGDVVGVNLGVTMSSTSPDFSLFNLSLGYIDTVGLFGSTNFSGFQGE